MVGWILIKFITQMNWSKTYRRKREEEARVAAGIVLSFFQIKSNQTTSAFIF